jgi:hypothetical protein
MIYDRCTDLFPQQNHKLVRDGELFSDPSKYCRRLVAKLNYLTITRHDVSYAVNVVSQFLKAPTFTLECPYLYFQYLKRGPR